MILSSLMLISCAGNQPAPENAAQTQAEMQSNGIVLAPAPDNKPGDDVIELWGEKVPDPYRWLEDDTQEGVQAWIKAQDARTREYLDQMPTRDLFVKRLSEIYYVSRISGGIPTFKGNQMFYYERAPKDELPTFYVSNMGNPDEPPCVLLDLEKLSDDGRGSLGTITYSPDGKLLTYKLHPNNADKGTMYVMDVETGKTLGDIIEDTALEEPAWLKDGSGFYYTYYPYEADKDYSEVSEIRTAHGVSAVGR